MRTVARFSIVSTSLMALFAGAVVATAPAASAFPPISGTCVATSTSAALDVCVNGEGNLLSFAAPTSNEDVQPVTVVPGAPAEGYSLCVNGDLQVAHDVEATGSGTGWKAAKVSQPTPGMFPITVRRVTTSGVFRLVQRWNAPVGSSIKLSETVTNLSAAMQQDVRLSRDGSFAPDASAVYPPSAGSWFGQGAPFGSVVLPVTPSGTFGDGILLKALSATTHVQTVEDGMTWATTSSSACDGGVAGPTTVSAPSTLAARVSYHLGSLAPGASATVVLRYQQI